MKWSRQYAGSDGKIHLPTAEEDAERQRRALSFRKSASRAANWTFAGPNKTYDTDGVTKVTWQTNIYSLDIAASNSNVLLQVVKMEVCGDYRQGFELDACNT